MRQRYAAFPTSASPTIGKRGDHRVRIGRRLAEQNLRRLLHDAGLRRLIQTRRQQRGNFVRQKFFRVVRGRIENESRALGDFEQRAGWKGEIGLLFLDRTTQSLERSKERNDRRAVILLPFGIDATLLGNALTPSPPLGCPTRRPGIPSAR